MLRVLILLSYLALLLAPLGPAEAQPACAMLAGAAAQDMIHPACGSDDLAPAHAHHSTTQACKQICAVLAILPPPNLGAAPSAIVLSTPRPSAHLLDSEAPDPSERPPKGSV